MEILKLKTKIPKIKKHTGRLGSRVGGVSELKQSRERTRGVGLRRAGGFGHQDSAAQLKGAWTEPSGEPSRGPAVTAPSHHFLQAGSNQKE